LTDFSTKVNSYYNSDLDDQYTNATVNIASARAAANMTLRTAYMLASNLSSIGAIPSTVQIDEQLFADLAHCLVEDMTCPLVQSFLNDSTITQLPSTYSTFGGPSAMARFAYYFLMNLTATDRGKACSTSSDCNNGQECVLQVCMTAPTTKYHDAFGTGLNLQKSQVVITDSSQPVWSESSWDSTTLRVFQVTAATTDIASLVTGVAITVLTLTVVFASRQWLKKTLKVS